MNTSLKNYAPYELMLISNNSGKIIRSAQVQFIQKWHKFVCVLVCVCVCDGDMVHFNHKTNEIILRSQSSGMFQQIVWHISTNILEEPAASIPSKEIFYRT